MKQITRCFLLILSLSLLSTGLLLHAQVTGARLTGQVTDATGAVIPQASVVITNTGTNATVKITSDQQGEYTAPPLAPGPYKILTSASGFADTLQTNITLTIGENATINVVLKNGAATDTVNVTSDVAIINASTAEISAVVGEDSIKELPLNGRDPSSLVFLTTGVTNELQSQASTLPSTNSFPTQSSGSAGGGRQGSTYYLLDGVTNMDYYALLAAPFPNADATQEFRVISNNFDARYGSSPGAVVSIQSKGGSNNFHGGSFEFLRNAELNASNYFSHTRDPLKRSQFGGYLGGPIKKDKLFFFANYQGTRASTVSTQNSTYTPTAAMLAGDFSAVAVNLKAPFATVNGKRNQIDPALFSPGAVAIAASLPLGGDPATGLTNFISPKQKDSYNEGTARIDYILNDRQRLFVRNFMYNFDQPGLGTPGNLLSGVQGLHGIYLNDAINHSWTLSQNLLNSITAYYQSFDFRSGTALFNKNVQQECLSKYISVSDPVGSCYIGGFSAIDGNSLYGGALGFSLFSGSVNDTRRRNWGVSDTVTFTHGRNTMYFGADILHRYTHESSGNGANPIVGIANSFTGFTLSDFLLGDVNSFSQNAGESGSVSGWMTGYYAQDQYKVRPNLTVNAGLRWDPYTPLKIAGGRGAAFVPGQQSTRYPNAPRGVVFPGDTGVNDAIMPTSWLYFEPRIGIAYQPAPKTSVRAGFGLFTTPLEDASYNHVYDTAPFDPSFSLNAGSTPISLDRPWSGFGATGGVSPFPPFASPSVIPASNSTFTLPMQLGAVFPKNFRLAVVQSWNLSIEQQFTDTLALHIAYVGSQTYHLSTPIELNPGSLSNPGDTRSMTNFGSIIQVQTGGTASYNSLQVGFEKRLSRSIQFQSNFTWSHAFDVGGSGDPSFESSVSDPHNIGHDHGPSSLNYPIVSVSNFIYQAPKLHNFNPIVRSVLGGWSLSGLITLQSGPPFTINGGNGNNNSGFLVYQDRADLTGAPLQVRQGSKANWLSHYFNAAAFTVNAVGTAGNSPKYLIQEAPIYTADLGVQKNWTYLEHYNLQLRFEAFNALNHPSFGQPDSNPDDSNFGAITSSGPIPARVGQAALKLTF
ncbi:carboxypeptidase regulatory-like domain-containing protein [Granulicella paludicola]|uniref:carboxypeptidase regulatory-like domain-containing protein n=1 Tax=Granulicella paludicola TaxID=474951 RepID=UPI0021DFCFD5|nr:carboxypeptidase regulatory-like domain-containing protein [Granulicella paludicola]